MIAVLIQHKLTFKTQNKLTSSWLSRLERRYRDCVVPNVTRSNPGLSLPDAFYQYH